MSENMSNNIYRWDLCSKCHKPTIRLKGEAYTNHSHVNILGAWYCKKCKIIYINPNLNLYQIIFLDIQKKVSKQKVQKIKQGAIVYDFNKVRNLEHARI